MANINNYLGALLRRRCGRKPIGSFDPNSLFAGGEDGGWYDPSDISTLWQDTARTTPVTTTGQNVLAIDDKSGNGSHLLAIGAVNATYQVDGDGKSYVHLSGTDVRFSVVIAMLANNGSHMGTAFQKDGVTTNLVYWGAHQWSNRSYNLNHRDTLHKKFQQGSATADTAFATIVHGAKHTAQSRTDAMPDGSTYRGYVRYDGAEEGFDAIRGAAMSNNVLVLGQDADSAIDFRFYGGFCRNSPDDLGLKVEVDAWLASLI